MIEGTQRMPIMQFAMKLFLAAPERCAVGFGIGREPAAFEHADAESGSDELTSDRNSGCSCTDNADVCLYDRRSRNFMRR